MNKKSTPFTRAAAGTLILILGLGWATWKHNEMRGGGADNPNMRIVEYTASNSGGDGRSIWADVRFFDGDQMITKLDVELPVTYEVAMDPGQLAKMVVETDTADGGGELDCDIYINGQHAAQDGDDLSRQFPNVECNAVVS